jgi:hypothetical protein
MGLYLEQRHTVQTPRCYFTPHSLAPNINHTQLWAVGPRCCLISNWVIRRTNMENKFAEVRGQMSLRSCVSCSLTALLCYPQSTTFCPLPSAWSLCNKLSAIGDENVWKLENQEAKLLRCFRVCFVFKRLVDRNLPREVKYLKLNIRNIS